MSGSRATGSRSSTSARSRREEACRAWKEEYGLEFPGDPRRRRRRCFAPSRTAGFRGASWSAPDGKVVFSENEFDESGFSAAIQQMYERPAVAKPTARRAVGVCRPHRRPGRRHRRAGGRARTPAAAPGRPPRRARRPRRRARLPAVAAVADGRRAPPEPVHAGRSTGCRGRGSSSATRKSRRSTSTTGSCVTASGDLDYDSLVVSLGAQLAPETVRGLRARWPTTSTAREGCARIHAALQDFTEGVVGILIPAMPFKCPAAPYEAAFLAESFLRRKGIRRNVEIHLFTPEHTPMPVAPAALGDSIADMLAARGIHYHPLFTFQELRPETREVVASDGSAHRVDLLIVRPAPPGTRGHSLVAAPRRLGLRPRRPADAADRLRGRVRDRRRRDDQAAQRQGAPQGGRLRPRRGEGRGASGSPTPPTARRPTPSFDGKGYCWIELGDGQSRLRRRQLLRRTRTPGQDAAARATAPLGQGGLREVVASPLALGHALQRTRT